MPLKTTRTFKFENERNQLYLHWEYPHGIRNEKTGEHEPCAIEEIEIAADVFIKAGYNVHEL